MCFNFLFFWQIWTSPSTHSNPTARIELAIDQRTNLQIDRDITRLTLRLGPAVLDPLVPNIVGQDLVIEEEREVEVDLAVRDAREPHVDLEVVQSLETVSNLTPLEAIEEGVEGHLGAVVVAMNEEGTGSNPLEIEAGQSLVIEGDPNTVPDQTVETEDEIGVEVSRGHVPEIVGGRGPIPEIEGEVTGPVPNPKIAIDSC